MSAALPARSREALETRVAMLWQHRRPRMNTAEIAESLDVHEAWVDRVVARLVDDDRAAGLR